MTKPRYVDLRSIKREDRKWKATFAAQADFIGAHVFELAVDVFESDDRDAAERPIEDCIRSVRKKIAAGLMVMAEEAMSALEQKDRDGIIENLQKLKANPGVALVGIPRDEDVQI